MHTLILILATILHATAAHLLYRTSPHQRWHGEPLPRRSTCRRAAVYAAAALTLYLTTFGGYGILIYTALSLTWLAVWPLIAHTRLRLPTWHPKNPLPALWRLLNRGEPHPAWLAKTAVALTCGSLSALLLATAYYRAHATDGEEPRYLAMWLGGLAWLTLLNATYLLRNGASAWRVHLAITLIAWLLYRAT